MKEAIDKFHCFYEETKLWEQSKWLGVPMWKLPFDAMVLQEIIFEVRPTYIIETGTGMGGSALFYASLCELLGDGQVITIDKAKRYDFNALQNMHQHLVDRITFLIGSSISGWAFEQVRQKAQGHKNIVILDSWHAKMHVLQEMYMYQSLVSVGSYMIVEDSHVNGHPVNWEWGEGPYEAIQEFLSHTDNFVIDTLREKYLMTFNPGGWLKKIK